ncbi:MAG: porin [Desulfobacterales bacterium]
MKDRCRLSHAHWLKSFITTVLFLFTITAFCSAGSEKDVTTEEIIDILKEKGIITDQEHENLMKKADEEKKNKEKAYTVQWNNGINVNRNDGAVKVKVDGRIHFHWGGIRPDSALRRNEDNGVYGDNALKGDGVEFRRARLGVSGTLWKNYLFKAQYDFAESDADFTDVYLGAQNIPVVDTLLVGQMREPFSLEELTSSNYITFIERSLPTNAFAPGRNSGIRANSTLLNKRLTWSLGAFYGDTDNDGDSNFDDATNADVTLRLTGLPVYTDKGKKMLHTGIGYSHQFRDEGKTTARYRTRPESHLTNARLVDTGRIDLDSADLFNPELAVVWGPFSLQGEYFWTKLSSKEADDPTFQGAYLYGSWFITGEHRPYSTSSSRFSRVIPNGNFFDNGPGAWELAARWSWVDLTDKLVEGGEENNYTFAINWYLNPNYRLMFNYIYADVKDRTDAKDGSTDIFQMRFQVDY